jgi:hypothetical protein
VREAGRGDGGGGEGENFLFAEKNSISIQWKHSSSSERDIERRVKHLRSPIRLAIIINKFPVTLQFSQFPPPPPLLLLFFTQESVSIKWTTTWNLIISHSQAETSNLIILISYIHSPLAPYDDNT